MRGSRRGYHALNMRRDSSKPVSVYGQTPPLPASAVFALHSEINCSPTAWDDYIGGKSLPGVNSPVVANDGAFFNGRVVAQTTAAGSAIWRNAALGTVLASGTRPWSFAVARVRNTVTSGTMVSYGRPAGSHDMSLQNTAGAPNRFNCFFLAAANPSTAPTPSDTNAHRFKSYLDGVNANMKVDNTNYQAATAASLGGNVTALAVGANAADASGLMSACVAYWLLCSSPPTAPEEAALDAWAAFWWGV